jgi:hypothetical protein
VFPSSGRRANLLTWIYFMDLISGSEHQKKHTVKLRLTDGFIRSEKLISVLKYLFINVCFNKIRVYIYVFICL